MHNPHLCPCHSGKPYAECCAPYHKGTPAENARALMRSRYAAYALQLADYIIQTTHPTNLAYKSDQHAWKQELVQYRRDMEFTGLDILEFVDGKERATVTFRAHLKQGDLDASFTEKSLFLKENGRWYYASGEILSDT